VPKYKCGTEAKLGDLVRFRRSIWGDGQLHFAMQEGALVRLAPTPQVAFVYAAVSDGLVVVNTLLIRVELEECEKAGLPIE
jgi:hypothetical protein